MDVEYGRDANAKELALFVKRSLNEVTILGDGPLEGSPLESDVESGDLILVDRHELEDVGTLLAPDHSQQPLDAIKNDDDFSGHGKEVITPAEGAMDRGGTV
jgi:hypothetical protein